MLTSSVLTLIAVSSAVCLAATVRPLRIPEKVELCKADPGIARAGETGSWTMPFVLARPVTEGESIWLYTHGGRHIKIAWPGLQAEDEQKSGYVSLQTESGEKLKCVATSIDHGTFAYEAPKGGLKAGDRLIARLGGEAGTTAPSLSEADKFILLVTGPSGARPSALTLRDTTVDRVVGACLIDVTGNRMKSFMACTNSDAVAGQKISILVRPEDDHRNIAYTSPGRLIVRLNGREIEARRSEVEGSTCCRLDGVVLPKPGIYRLEVEDTARGIKTLTNPIRCSEKERPDKLYWGLLHGHTAYSDGTGSLDSYYTCLRDGSGLDFGAVSDHDHAYETTDAMWKAIQEAAIKYNDPGRFTAFLGYEWAKWRRNGDGDRNVYYLHDNRPMYRSEDDAYPRPPDMFKAIENETAMVIPHHPAEAGNFCDWKDHDPEKERLVEIYSVWGCSERSVNQGNPFPVKGPNREKLDSGEVPKGFVQKGLELGWRIGFTAGSDDHTGHPGELVYTDSAPWEYQGGLTAVYAGANNRKSLWKGLWDRQCFGTTGARMIVEFDLNGHPMGSVLPASEQLASARKLKVTVHGTAKIKTIEVVRNNQDVHTVSPNTLDAQFEWTDTEPLKEINLTPTAHSPESFTFYYARITQEDGEMAWVSPVWILSDEVSARNP